MGAMPFWACAGAPLRLTSGGRLLRVLMIFGFLTGLALVLLAGAGFALWRRLEAMRGEIATLRAQVNALESVGAIRRRARGGEGLRLAQMDEDIVRDLKPEAATVHHLQSRAPSTPNADPFATLRGVALALAAVAPALGFLLGLDMGPAAAIGVGLGGLMMLLALRQRWRAAAWAGVLTASAWSALALGFGAAAAGGEGLLSAALAFAGAAGLAQAFLLRVTPGAALTLVSAIVALALGAQLGLIGPAGAAFGAIVALAATVGALNLRLEAIHLGAFAAALIGLFVLSGQETAAIWFTPVSAWVGALFLGIAAIRVPDLGARGVSLAGTGVLAPLCAIAALHWSGHGLGEAWAAAAALVATGAAFAGVVVAAASRGARTLSSLRLSLWVLAGGAFAALCGAIFLVGSPSVATSAFAACALALLALDQRWPDAVWRTLAWCAGTFTALNAAVAMALILRETGAPLLQLSAGYALPMLLSGACAFLAQRRNAPITAGAFEALTILFAVVGASLLLRVLVSGGALIATPVSFPEAGLHIALWLVISLLLAARARYGAQSVRGAAAIGLGALALAASAGAMLMWLTPHWSERAPGADAGPLLQFAGLGFLAPAILFGAHWVMWRGHGSNLRTRLSLGASALMMAAMVTLLALQTGDGGTSEPDWFGTIVGAVAFALAIGLNFANGVTRTSLPRASYFKDNFPDTRRRQSRRPR